MSEVQHPWVSALGVSEEKLEGWDKENGLLSPLFANEVISEPAYLNWAHEYYQIPRMEKDFFYFPFESKNIDAYLSEAAWNKEMYPIYKWENVLYIACLYPRELQVEGVKICWILAPPQALQHLWHAHISSLITDTPAPTVAPLGLSDSEEIMEAFDFGFNKKEANSEDKTAALNNIAPAENELSAYVPEPLGEEELTVPPIPNHVADPVVQSNSDEPAYLGLQNLRILDDNFLNEAKDHVQDCGSIEEGVICIVKKVRGFYKKIMWLSPSVNSYQAKLAWGNWDFDKEKAGTEVDLEKANVFKIIHNTKMPFHGKVAMNDINQRYIDWWNGCKEWDHLTIQPVIVNEECFGCIIGADKGREFDSTMALKQMDRLSKRLADTISKIIKEVA